MDVGGQIHNPQYPLNGSLDGMLSRWQKTLAMARKQIPKFPTHSLVPMPTVLPHLCNYDNNL